MEIQEFLRLIRNKKQTIIIVTILFVLISIAFTFVQPLRYSAVSKVLVIQGLPEGIDPYQISKSNEYVASLLTQVISTNSFLKEVLNSGFNIDKTYFPETSDKQMKLWKKTVKSSSDSNGIITIKTYHDNRVQVNQLSKAINFIIKSKHELYHGFGDLVKIKIIEQPVTSDRPIKPNIFINISVAFIFGLLISLTYIYLFPDYRYNLHLKPQRNDSLIGDDMEISKDEFEIANYNIANQKRDNQYNENANNIEDVRREIKEIKKYVKNNKNTLPSNLPIENESENDANAKTEINNIHNTNIQARNIKEQGSMNNIINQTNQRT